MKKLFNAGHIKKGGRKKGVQNKVTNDMKKAIHNAFEEIGGVSQLSTWAKSNQTEFYTKIWVKIIPKDIHIKDKTLEDILNKVNSDEEAEEEAEN